jgi:hypothetical protein
MISPLQEISLMIWDIVLAVAAGLCQFVTAWLGWRITMHPIRLNDPKQKRKRIFYEVLFSLTGVLGVMCTGVIAYRVPRDRAHFNFNVGTVYKNARGETSWSSGTGERRAEFLQIDAPLAFNVYRTNVGPGTSMNTVGHQYAFIEPDGSPTSESEALARFEKSKAMEPNTNIGTVPKGNSGFVTAHGATLSPEDYDNLADGRRVAYVVGEVLYEDDSGKHSRHFCYSLETPQPGGFLIWALCRTFNDEN